MTPFSHTRLRYAYMNVPPYSISDSHAMSTIPCGFDSSRFLRLICALDSPSPMMDAWKRESLHPITTFSPWSLQVEQGERGGGGGGRKEGRKGKYLNFTIP